MLDAVPDAVRAYLDARAEIQRVQAERDPDDPTGDLLIRLENRRLVLIDGTAKPPGQPQHAGVYGVVVASAEQIQAAQAEIRELDQRIAEVRERHRLRQERLAELAAITRAVPEVSERDVTDQERRVRDTESRIEQLLAKIERYRAEAEAVDDGPLRALEGERKRLLVAIAEGVADDTKLAALEKRLDAQRKKLAEPMRQAQRAADTAEALAETLEDARRELAELQDGLRIVRALRARRLAAEAFTEYAKHADKTRAAWARGAEHAARARGLARDVVNLAFTDTRLKLPDPPILLES